MAIIRECGNFRRFNSTTKFIEYLELVPTENSDGNSKIILYLSKRDSSIAKHILYMSSIYCLLYN